MQQFPTDTAPKTPDWRLIGTFYAICFSWVSLVALGLHLAGVRLDSSGSQLTFLFAISLLYMPAPLVSALIAEKIAGRRPLIRTTFVGFGRKLPRVLLTYVALSAAVCLTFLLLGFVFGNLAHVPGVGRLATSQAELNSNLTALADQFTSSSGAAPAKPAGTMPPIGLLYGLTLLVGLVAGVTVNGLFAFGEEYGWRGFLMDELRPLGDVKANLVTGVLWGLWHAPIILLGYDFGPYRFPGIFAMVVLCTSLSFLLWRARQFTDSLLIPAMLHGAFNAYGGVFLLVMPNRNPLVSVPIGLLGAAGIGLVALVFWKWSAGKLAEARP